MTQEKVIVLDMGAQYAQLIARRVRENHVYSEIHSYKTDIRDLKNMDPTAIIITGGPNSVYLDDSPTYDRAVFELGIPVLGICYGAQLMMHVLGGRVGQADVREYGKTKTLLKTSSKLFAGIPEESTTWMSHFDCIQEPAEGFAVTGRTDACPAAAVENEEKKLYAVQFHPEVMHTEFGSRIFHNFLYNVCGCRGDWTMTSFIDDTVKRIREEVGNGKVLLGLSGGVDSSVAAALLSRAVGKNLTCLFVDHGLLRKNESEAVEKMFTEDSVMDLNFVKADASDRFLSALAGETHPEGKRLIIGKEFANVFREAFGKIYRDENGAFKPVDFLAQGTIYPDVVESGVSGESAKIKTHHNTVLQKGVDYNNLIEPLRSLFKDEVRQVGIELGLPDSFVYRQPFPGPGLGVRILGEITREKIRTLQDADAILREEIDEAVKQGRMERPSQYFAVLTNTRTVGVMGDERTYDHAVALRAVLTDDFMTAEISPIPYDVLNRIMTRMVNEVRGINRVLYDVTSKPPGTVEFE